MKSSQACNAFCASSLLIFFVFFLVDVRLCMGESVRRPKKKPVEVKIQADESSVVRIPLAQTPKTVLLVKKLSQVPCPDACENLIMQVERGEPTIALQNMVAGLSACLMHLEENQASYNPVVRQFLKRNLSEYRVKLIQDHGALKTLSLTRELIDNDLRHILVQLGDVHLTLLSPETDAFYRALKSDEKDIEIENFRLGLAGFLALLDVLEQEDMEQESGDFKKYAGERVAKYKKTYERIQLLLERIEKAQLLAMSTLDGARRNPELFDSVPRVYVHSATVPGPLPLRELDLTDTDDFDIDALVAKMNAARVDERPAGLPVSKPKPGRPAGKFTSTFDTDAEDDLDDADLGDSDEDVELVDDLSGSDTAAADKTGPILSAATAKGMPRPAPVKLESAILQEPYVKPLCSIPAPVPLLKRCIDDTQA